MTEKTEKRAHTVRSHVRTDKKGVKSLVKQHVKNAPLVRPTTEPPVNSECSICQTAYDGWGNNALPVNDGRCCDDCNAFVVIPARLNRVYGRPVAKVSVAALRMMREVPNGHA